MGTLAAAAAASVLFQTKLETSSFLYGTRRGTKKKQPIVPVARLFGPAIFEESKLEVLFLGADEEESNPRKLPRTYTLTHSDITSKLTLAISHTVNTSQVNFFLGQKNPQPKKISAQGSDPELGLTSLGTCMDLFDHLYYLTSCYFRFGDINMYTLGMYIDIVQLQGWYNRFQRDEVVAEWKKIKGKMSLHVHCHISGDHFWLNLCAGLRYYIFSKELPVVLKAFGCGDENLFNNYPELQEALVWVYFHSNISRFNKTECWGPFNGIWATYDGTIGPHREKKTSLTPQICADKCTCCFPAMSLIPWAQN